MKKETNLPPPLRAFAESHIGLEVSTEATAQLGPVPKPPWYKRLGGRFETIVIGFITNQLPPLDWNAVWDAIQRLWQLCFGRRCQPAAAAQV